MSVYFDIRGEESIFQTSLREKKYNLLYYLSQFA